MANRLLEVSKDSSADLVCFSHLRWDFVYQRPQHLMSRLAADFRIFFIEEPVFHHAADASQIRLTDKNIWVVTPLLRDDNADVLSHVVEQRKHQRAFPGNGD